MADQEEVADVLGAVPPEPTMPGAESQTAPAPPVGVTVYRRTVEVSEAGGSRRLVEMPEAEQLDCHPDIVEATP
jgi:hypothetical protein